MLYTQANNPLLPNMEQAGQMLMTLCAEDTRLAAGATRMEGRITSEGDTVSMTIRGILHPYGDVNVERLLNELDNAVGDSTRNISVEIASPGGLLDYGQAIHASLLGYRRKGLKVTTRAMGTVASAAVLPLIAGAEATAEVGSQIMVHAPYTAVLAFLDANADENPHYVSMMNGLKAAKAAFKESLDAAGVKDTDKMLSLGDHWFSVAQGKSNNLLGSHTLPADGGGTNADAGVAATILRLRSEARQSA